MTGSAAGDGARLAWARAYPYEAPENSYIYHADGIRAFEMAETEGRTPVLAIGSNRAPERLKQKYGHDPSHTVPVQRARLKNFDIVYATHITAYGAAPAMLQVSPGTEIALWITWLTDAQLEIMHKTEIAAANYHYAALNGVSLHLENGRRLSSVHAYVGRRGHFVHNKAPLAMAAVPSRARRYPVADTSTALAHMHRQAGMSEDLDAFILRCIDDPDYRATVVDALSKSAVPFSFPYRILS